MASATQIKLIRRYAECDGVSEENWKAELQRRFGKSLLEEMTEWQAWTLLIEMQQRERFQKQERENEEPSDKADQ